MKTQNAEKALQTTNNLKGNARRFQPFLTVLKAMNLNKKALQVINAIDACQLVLALWIIVIEYPLVAPHERSLSS